MTELKPWIAEIQMTQILAKKLIEDQFPTLSPVTIKDLGSGWDNTAYCVNDAYVFRFPRRKEAVALMDSEYGVLPTLAELLPLVIPDPKFYGKPTEDFKWPFIGYLMLPGKTACSTDLSDKERIRSTKTIAEFLSALHSFDTNKASQLGAGPDVFKRLKCCKYSRKMIARFEKIKKLGYIDNFHPYLDQAGIYSEIEYNGPEILVHGDLYARHLLVDEQNNISGVIDWGDMHIGIPASDFSIAHSFLPSQSHDTFRNTYGEIDESTWKLARLAAIHSMSHTITYGHDIKDDNLIRESLVGLKYLKGSL